MSETSFDGTFDILPKSKWNDNSLNSQIPRINSIEKGPLCDINCIRGRSHCLKLCTTALHMNSSRIEWDELLDQALPITKLMLI